MTHAALFAAGCLFIVGCSSAGEKAPNQGDFEKKINESLLVSLSRDNQVVSVKDCVLTIRTKVAEQCQGPQDVGMLSKTVSINLAEFLPAPSVRVRITSPGVSVIILDPYPDIRRAFQEIQSARATQLRNSPNGDAYDQQMNLARDAEIILSANNILSRSQVRSCSGATFDIEPGDHELRINIADEHAQILASHLEYYSAKFCNNRTISK